MDIGSIKNSTVANNAGVLVDGGQRASTRTLEPEQAVPALKADDSAPVAREDVEAAVATIQDFVQSVRRDLNFSLEEGSGRVVVKVTDSGSGDVIRQIPSEEALQLAENLSEVRSLLFKAEA